MGIVAKDDLEQSEVDYFVVIFSLLNVNDFRLAFFISLISEMFSGVVELRLSFIFRVFCIKVTTSGSLTLSGNLAIAESRTSRTSVSWMNI